MTVCEAGASFVASQEQVCERRPNIPLRPAAFPKGSIMIVNRKHIELLAGCSTRDSERGSSGQPVMVRRPSCFETSLSEVRDDACED